jgi:hypothetical protein
MVRQRWFIGPLIHMAGHLHAPEGRPAINLNTDSLAHLANFMKGAFSYQNIQRRGDYQSEVEFKSRRTARQYTGALRL